MPSIILEHHSSHAIIHLNRPEKLNALSGEMFESLASHLDQLQHDDNLRALILAGSGERAFCSGTDITELTTTDAKSLSARGQHLCDQIENFPIPVIAAINGVAAGGGLELVLACHLRIASTLATFSLPETKLGLIPGYGGTQRLTRELGVGRALDLMLTGKSITAEEALAFGLLNRVVGPANLMSEAVSLAESIARMSTLSIKACLQAVIKGQDLSLQDGLQLETQLFASLFTTEDAREGTTAFIEKRSPIFKGR
ncbi:MAG TPA: enoyl-CoA hydratase-related protein [Pyrinomonadaceae bacterium]